MIVKQQPLNCGLSPEGTNGYFVMNKETKEMVIVDPGGEINTIKRIVDEMDATPVAILLTHSHIDHIGALGDTQKEYGVPVYCGREEKDLLNFFLEMLKSTLGITTPASVDIWLDGGEELDLAGFKIDVIHTPGHSPGGMCFYIEDENVLFSGDTLFYGSIGRTDFPFPGARTDYNTLISNVKMLLDTLPGDVAVLSGHGPATTIAREKKHNPFVR